MFHDDTDKLLEIVITKVKANASIEAPFGCLLNTVKLPNRYVNGCERLGLSVFISSSFTGGFSKSWGQRIRLYSRLAIVGFDVYRVLMFVTAPFLTATFLTSTTGSPNTQTHPIRYRCSTMQEISAYWQPLSVVVHFQGQIPFYADWPYSPRMMASLSTLLVPTLIAQSSF